MVQVRVLGIALDAVRQHIVLLKPLFDDGDEGRVLPIWIGTQEATSILIAISGEQAPRPLSHDLMRSLLELLGAEVQQVEVTRIEAGTFFAEITLSTPTGTRVIDARPSDAVALAVRTDASIFVADEVLAEAGIPAALADLHGEEEKDEAKVDEFKRFLDDVDPEDFQG
jgi:bifunctional DNase/RNase